MLHWVVTLLFVLAILASVLDLPAIGGTLVAGGVLVACLWGVVGFIVRMVSEGTHALR